MSNVLPSEARAALWRMYRSRFILVGASVFLLVALLSFGALLPGYVALRSSGATLSEQDTKTITTDKKESEELAYAQSLLAVLSPFTSASTTPTRIIRDALVARPKGLLVTHIIFSGGKSGEIVLSGSATSLEAIQAYQEALRADPQFTNVSVPVGDLAGTGDGGFSITLSGNFSGEL